MALDKDSLPQLRGKPFLTDGGLETTLIFHDGVDLPGFAAFPLVMAHDGRERLRRYFDPYLRIAVEQGMGFILDTPTWRASRDWGARLGYTATDLAEINRVSVVFAAELRDAFASDDTPVLIDGVLGPRGDGYRPDQTMTGDEARDYHAEQIATLAGAGVDMISAFTLSTSAEAAGIALAARDQGMPAVISFTVETDGRLASGETLASAIAAVDAASKASPAYYMINCAHPSHFVQAMPADQAWTRRIMGLRANASAKSHAELDEAEELDSGDPQNFGDHYGRLCATLPWLTVLGGCCGTDHRHIRAISEAGLRVQGI